MKQLPTVVLKGCSYVAASLCVPSAFGGRAGFGVEASHVFPQDVLVAVSLVGSGARDGGARAGTRCEVGLPLCSVARTTL